MVSGHPLCTGFISHLARSIISSVAPRFWSKPNLFLLIYIMLICSVSLRRWGFLGVFFFCIVKFADSDDGSVIY